MGSPSERVLITGGTGFTGRPLAQRLRADAYDVLTLGHDAENAGASAFDLCDFAAIKGCLSRFGPSVIVHLAGIAATQHDRLDQIYAANVIGTANLFEAARSSSIAPRLIIMASSAQVYAPTGSDLPIREDSRLCPQSHYGVSKHAAEEIASVYAQYFPISICRPFNYTGPGQTTAFLVPKIVQHYAQRRREIRLGNLDLYRDISDVERVVEAYSRLISRPMSIDIVNICCGRPSHLVDIIQIMDDIAGYSINVVHDPALVRNDEPRSFVGSPARLEELVGHLPNPELRQTLVRMYEHATHSANGASV